MTAVDWLIENLMINGFIRLTKEEHGLYKELTGLAKQMEKEQTEISNEEIEKSNPFRIDGGAYNSSAAYQWSKGAQWYREKFKSKQQ